MLMKTDREFFRYLLDKKIPLLREADRLLKLKSVRCNYGMREIIWEGKSSITRDLEQYIEILGGMAGEW